MAIETLSGEYAALPGPGAGLFGNCKIWLGRYSFPAVAVEDGDIRKVLKINRRSLVVGGELWAGDLDAGTAAINFDVGWTANGAGTGAGTTYTIPGTTVTFANAGAVADPDGFIASGVFTAAAITNLLAAGINYRPVPLPAGPLYFAEDTNVQFEVNAAAATPAAAEAWLILRYLVV